MASLLYCIRYPVKPFLASPNGFLLGSANPNRQPDPTHSSFAPRGFPIVPCTDDFSRAAITGRIRSISFKIESSVGQTPSIRHVYQRAKQRCSAANARDLTGGSNRDLRLFISDSANISRQATIPDQATRRRP